MENTINNLSKIIDMMSRDNVHYKAIERYCDLYSNLLLCLYEDVRDGVDLDTKELEKIKEQQEAFKLLYSQLNDYINYTLVDPNQYLNQNLEELVSCLRKIKKIQVIIRRVLISHIK